MPGESDDISDLTREQQLGQLFMIGFPGLEPPPAVVELIQRRHVGGIILFSRNCQSARQVSQLTHDLQALARAAGHPAPLLIAVDQENGLVQRLGDAITTLPGAMALGATGSEELARAVAEATGQELRALGINMNLAPDADVNSNAANPVIGVRSFGSDPQAVARLVEAFTRGQRAAGVASALKHFPGHGDTATDSHRALPFLPHSLERLEQTELPPFRAGVAAGAESVMLAHLRLPHLAPDETIPASLSPTVVRLLRQSLGFTGVIMTDCLEMDAVAKTVGVAEGAALAAQAGVDLILISHTAERQNAAIARVTAALDAGELAAEAVQAAAQRVLRLKQRLLAWETLPAPVASATVSEPAHQRLRDEAYQRAVTLVRDDARLLPLRPAPAARLLVIAQAPASVTQASDSVYQHAALVEAVRRRHANSQGVLLAAEADEEAIAEALAQAQAADLLIVATLNADRDARQAALIQRLIATRRPIVAIAACSPYDVAAFPHLGAYLATYEYTPAALATVAGALFGEFAPQGRLPVSLLTASDPHVDTK